MWCFASFTNWTTTARAVLPAAPAAAILLARELERARRPLAWSRAAIPLAASLALALAVAQADHALASSTRVAADTLVARYADMRAAQRADMQGRLYFQGGWGFQQYMEEAGATRLDLRNLKLQPGDWVIARLNSNVVPLPQGEVLPIGRLDLPAGWGVTTLSLERGAGFYAALYGPLPYSFGPVPLQSYTVGRVMEPIGSKR